MIKNVIFGLIILLFLLLSGQGFSSEPPKSQWLQLKGSLSYNAPFYNVGPNHIVFSMGFSFPNDWRNELEINNIADGMAKHSNSCHVARVWRWEILPENSPAVLILTWYNQKTGEYGWSAIKNTDKHWYVASNYQSWMTQKDYTTIIQKSYTTSPNMWFHWVTNATKITIMIRNPNNENGWNSNDIWYQFNYF